MLRSLPLTAESPHALDDIRRAFEDRRYWHHRLSAFEGGSPVLDSLSTDPSGATSVAMTMRFGGDQLPDPLRRLRLGSLVIAQRERWHTREDDTLCGVISITAVRTPMSGRGTVELVSAGAGTALSGTATVTVDVPFIGGAIATFIANQLAIGIVDVIGVTDSWLRSRAA